MLVDGVTQTGSEKREEREETESASERRQEIFSVFTGKLFSGEAAGEVWGSSEDGQALESWAEASCGTVDIQRGIPYNTVAVVSHTAGRIQESERLRG